MSQRKAQTSRKRQRIAEGIGRLRARLGTGLASGQVDFVQKEILKLQQELANLTAGTPAQRKTGWARGMNAPEFTTKN